MIQTNQASCQLAGLSSRDIHEGNTPQAAETWQKAIDAIPPILVERQRIDPLPVPEVVMEKFARPTSTVGMIVLLS